MEFRQKNVQCISPSGLHRMAYTEWGDPANTHVLLCVHGLTRNGRDFDTLARTLSQHYRVVCPDIVGRGKSSRLRQPAGYGIPQYVADIVTLIARLGVESVDWVGTSMGGLIGMTLASQDGTPIRRMVLNDVGPVITAESLRRLATYVGTDPLFPDFASALAYIRIICAPFGALDEDQWLRLAEHTVAQRADGQWGFVYDPKIAEPFKAAFVEHDIDLWPVYEAIRCPVLAIRGGDSDLLTRDVWQAMGMRGPQARLAEIPGVGHAPMFQTREQIDVVRDFLLAA